MNLYLSLLLTCFLCIQLKAQLTLSEAYQTRHPDPQPNFIVKGLCAGDSTYFFDRTTNGGYAYHWDIVNDKGDTIYSSSSKKIVYFFNKIGTYYVTLISYNGHYASMTKTLLVDTVPHADFLFSYCYNQFYNYSTCSDQFVWIFPDSTVSTQDFPSYTFDKAGAYSVMLIAKKGAKADTLVKQIKIASDSLGFPDGTFTSSLKDTSQLIFDFTALDTSGTNYFWSFGDGQYDNTSGYKVTHTMDIDVYMPPVVLSVSNGCGIGMFDLDPFKIICLQPTNGFVTNITSSSAVLRWNGVGIGYDVEWGLQGFTLGTGAPHATDSTIYTLTGLQMNTAYSFYVRTFCDSLSTAYIGPYSFTTLSVGADEKTLAPVIIFPNPGNAQFVFSNLKEENQIEIYDITGRLIYHTVSKNNTCTIDLMSKDKGVYFYKITNEKGDVQQGKIILQ